MTTIINNSDLTDIIGNLNTLIEEYNKEIQQNSAKIDPAYLQETGEVKNSTTKNEESKDRPSQFFTHQGNSPKEILIEELYSNFY